MNAFGAILGLIAGYVGAVLVSSPVFLAIGQFVYGGVNKPCPLYAGLTYAGFCVAGSVAGLVIGARSDI